MFFFCGRNGFPDEAREEHELFHFIMDHSYVGGSEGCLMSRLLEAWVSGPRAVWTMAGEEAERRVQKVRRRHKVLVRS